MTFVPAPTPVPEVHPVWEELEADGPQVGIVIPSEADREQIEAACNELLERAITFEASQGGNAFHWRSPPHKHR